jgi:LPXTG-site transpeptidase (sortase) family protein
MRLKLAVAGVLLLGAAGVANYLHLGETHARVYLPDTPLTQLLDTVSGEADAAPQPPAGMRLQLPAIGVDAPVDELGTDASGHLEAPTKWQDVGWYSGGARPGDAGSALLMGHVDSHTGPAVFWNLHELKAGSLVVVRQDGRDLQFHVVKAMNFPETEPPKDELFSRQGASRVVLLTCSGEFNQATGRYTDRLMVIADLA